MSKKIRIAVIGAGAIARDHVRGCQTHPDGEVVAIADPAVERAQTVAREFGISRVTDRSEDLLKDPEIDAVTIATPNKFHATYAVAALKSGKHVCLEKPFAMNAVEARRVIAEARRSGKVFTVAMNWRFRPEAQTLRSLVQRGDLGEIYYAKSYVLRRTGSPKFGTWFCQRAFAGGGALLDIGVHFLDLCLYLLGDFNPATVSGAVYSKFGPRGLGEGSWGHSTPAQKIFDVDDFGTAFIKMKSGVTIQLEASWVLHMDQPGRMSVELFGTEGGASVSPLRIFQFAKRKREYQITELKPGPLRYPHANRFHNWLDAIAGKDELEVQPEQALTVQKILDAIYRSAATGREVRIS